MRHFGTASTQEEVDVLYRLALNYKQQLQAQTAPLEMFDKDTTDSIGKLHRSAIRKQPGELNVNLKNTVEEKRRRTGGHQVFWNVPDKVGSDNIFSDTSRRGPSVNLLKNI